MVASVVSVEEARNHFDGPHGKVEEMEHLEVDMKNKRPPLHD